MQDRKALQAGTSHFLGQNFSKASDIRFQGKDEKEQFAWTTSWGVSTHLVGALVMTHSDDDGLVLPPRLAPSHVVVIPVIRDEKSRAEVLSFCEKLVSDIRGLQYEGSPIEVEFDVRDMRGGDKAWSWVKKGVPVRVEVGPRDIADNKVFVGRRDQGMNERYGQGRDEFVASVPRLLEEIQEGLLAKAKAFREANTRKIDTKEEFYEYFTPKNADKPEIHGGFALSHWSGEEDVEEQLKKDLNVTIRCIPIDSPEEEGVCVISGKPSRRRVVFGKAY